MIATTMTMAFAMIAGAHESWVTANETARYEQLALRAEAQEQEQTEDYEEWTGYEEYFEPHYEPTYYYEPSYEQTGDAPDLQSAGVVYDGGTRYTWYSQNVLPGGGLADLNANGRHVGDGGYVMDGDGYIAVASGDLPMGSVVDTPWGAAKVYDRCGVSGTVDVYVAW